MKKDNLHTLLSGTLKIESKNNLRIELKNEQRTLAVAALDFTLLDKQQLVKYHIPLPTYTEMVGCSEIMELWLFADNVEYKIKDLPTEKLLAHSTYRNDVIRFVDKIAPSFGFIGGAFNDPLILDVYMQLQSVKIELIDKKDFLNFNRIELLDKEGKSISPDEIKSVQFSSSMSEPVEANKILGGGGGFHSKLDSNPWLVVEFNVPTFVSQIHFVNRSDKWGLRAKGLRISVSDNLGREHHAYQQSSATNKVVLFEHLQTMLGQKLFNIHLDRITVLNYLIDYFNQTGNASDLAADEVALIPQLLSSWDTVSSDNVDVVSIELKLLAIYLVFSMNVRISLNIQCFENLLNRRVLIQQLEDNINELREKSGEPLIEVTKHGTALASKLTANPQALLESIKTLVEDLEELNVRPCIAYGTLLGAYRDNKFIAHDDDVDLLIELPESDLSVLEALKLHEKIVAQLDPKKYIVKRASERDDRLNLHVYVIKTSVLLDLFPYWYNDGLAMLHMEKMQIRGIASEALSGRKSIALYDYTFPAPDQPTLFLSERYGKGWETPDKFHEWPWKLKDDVEFEA